MENTNLHTLKQPSKVFTVNVQIAFELLFITSPKNDANLTKIYIIKVTPKSNDICPFFVIPPIMPPTNQSQNNNIKLPPINFLSYSKHYYPIIKFIK